VNKLSIFAIAVALCFATFAFAAPYTTYTDIPEGTVIVPSTGEQPGNTPSNLRTLAFFSDRASFRAICPGLAFENFGNTNVPTGAITACDPPFNSATNNACFSPGDIVAGVSLNIQQGPPQQLVVIGLNGLGNSNVAVGPNTFLDDGIIELTVPANALGLDVWNPFGPGTWLVEVFSGVTSLGVTAVNGGPVPTFWGVASDTDQITRLEWTDGQGGEDGELWMNMEFGLCGTTPVEPATWGGIKETFTN
jgi:hypothetical protein